MPSSILDLAGVGIGPFNLSVAALLDPVDGVRARFFDRAATSRWHSGLMLPGVRLQTSWLKDLVSAVAPTSPFSFTSYLVAHKRFYRFLNADFDRIPRQEFANYLAWVAGQLDTLSFGTNIEALDFDGEAFVLTCAGGREGGREGGRGESRVRARNLVLATGVRPFVPDWAERHLSDRCFHAGRIAEAGLKATGQRIAVIGGGQTGAEVMQHLLADGCGAADRTMWISRRANFLPIDETAFTNEYFTPGYVERFYALPPSRKAHMVEEQRLAGDGISTETIRDLYRRLYTLAHLEDRPDAAMLLPNRQVVGMDDVGGAYRLMMRNGLTGEIETAWADVVILATGFQGAYPDCLGPLVRRLRFDTQGRFVLNRRFALEWDGPAENRIYVQNVGRYSHGIAEPQLSVMAWRSGVIVNDLLRRPLYDTEDGPDLLRWDAPVGRPDERPMLRSAE